MSVRMARTLRILLLVVACIACIVGVSQSQAAAKKAATDTSRISIRVTDKKSYTDSNYTMDVTFTLENGTKVEWGYLDVTTYVYDKSGNELGRMTSEFGSLYGSSGFSLEPGKTVTKTVTFSSGNPDDFFLFLYEANLSDLTFESKVTQGSYYK